MNFTSPLDKLTIYSAFVLMLLCASFSSLALAGADLGGDDECTIAAASIFESKKKNITKLTSNSEKKCRVGEVSSPAATWLFGCALMGFVGVSNKRRV